MKTKLFLFVSLMLLAVSSFAQTQYQQTVSVLTATIDSVAISTIGVHQMGVQWIPGTVAGSYTTCTVQPKTTFDGTNYLTLGPAFPVTITSNTLNAFTVTEPLATAVSATAANSFGINTKLTLACGAYGTTAPSALSIIPQAIAGLSCQIAGVPVSSTALETSHVGKAAPGTLCWVVGTNTKASAQYILVFNSTTVPADTTVPIFCFVAAASSNFSFAPPGGATFNTGIAVSNSSTCATKTVGSADLFLDIYSQ